MMPPMIKATMGAALKNGMDVARQLTTCWMASRTFAARLFARPKKLLREPKMTAPRAIKMMPKRVSMTPICDMSTKGVRCRRSRGSKSSLG